MIQDFRIEIKWAVIFTALNLAWILLERMAGFHGPYLHLQPQITVLFILPTIAVYVLALREKKREFYRGGMNYIDGLISGAILTLLITLLSPLVQLLSAKLISPEFFRNAIEYSVGRGVMNRENAETYFSLNSYIRQALLANPVIGMITTSLVAYFIRTKPDSGSKISQARTF